MPDGLWYARGPAVMREGIPGSAFSKGDLLVFDSGSSLSGAPIAGAGLNNIAIAGVAKADSLQSFNDKVPYVLADPSAIFWSVATQGSAFTPGFEVDFDVDAAGRPVVLDSQATARFVIEEVEADGPDPSVQSRVLGRFIGLGSADTVKRLEQY